MPLSVLLLLMGFFCSAGYNSYRMYSLELVTMVLSSQFTPRSVSMNDNIKARI